MSPPSRSAVADPAELVAARLDDDPVADVRGRHVGPDPVDDTGHLVAEAHGCPGRPGDPSHLDIGQVAAADAARGDPHITSSRTGSGSATSSTRTSPGTVHPNLQHRDALRQLSSG